MAYREAAIYTPLSRSDSAYVYNGYLTGRGSDMHTVPARYIGIRNYDRKDFCSRITRDGIDSVYCKEAVLPAQDQGQSNVCGYTSASN